MLDIRDIRIIQSVHEQGSLARASRVLGMGQPALTRALAGLESRLRGKLFERGRRGMTPTDLCRAVLPEATEILARMQRLDRHLAEVRGSQVQDLSIIAGAYAAETIGMVAAARMLAVHHAVRIRLASGNWAEVPRAVREREASIGILDLSELGDCPDFTVEKLRPAPGIFVVRPGHPLVNGRPPLLADILAWPFVFIGRVPRRVQEPMAIAREQARAAGRLHPAFPALIHESPTLALTAVRHSDAVAGVTVPIAATLLATGALVALPWREPWVSVHYGVIRPRHHRGTEAEEAFLDLLRTADHEAETVARRFLAEAKLDAATS